VRLTCTDHRIIEILGLRPSNRLPVSFYMEIVSNTCKDFINDVYVYNASENIYSNLKMADFFSENVTNAK
jgi:hypothetical protein